MSKNPNHMTHKELMAAIAPKSDQLNSVDLLLSPVTVTIKSVRACKGEKHGEVKAIIEIEGDSGPMKPWKPCKSMLRILARAQKEEEEWANAADEEIELDTELWIGQRVTLWCDPKAVYGGEEVGGIRISHLSVLKAPRKFPVTIRRGLIKQLTIHPLVEKEKPDPTPAPTPEEQKYITDATELLETVETLDELKAHGEILKNKSKTIQDALRPVYTKRKKALEGGDESTS